MAINKKLIHFQTLANFNAQLSAGNILDTSIVFIKDAKKIWTHGQLYDCSGESGDTKSSAYAMEFTIAQLIDPDSTISPINIANLTEAVSRGDVIVVPLGGEYNGYVNAVGVEINPNGLTYIHVYIPSELGLDYNTVINISFDSDGNLDETIWVSNLDTHSLKTINGQSILGRGDITIQGGSGGDCLPLTGGTLTGPVVFKNGGSISVNSDNNLNVSIDETLYIDNDVRSTYGSVRLEEGVFEYANGDGGYTQATGVAYKKVGDLNGGTVTLLDDIFYDFTTMISGNVRFALGTKRGSGHYMFRFYVQSGYSVTLPNTLYFLGDEPTEKNSVYEVSVYNSVTICVKIGTKNIYGGQ